MRKANFTSICELIPVILGGILLCLFSCSHSLQDMVDEYNSNFVPTKDKEEPSKPGDEDFDPDLMLFPTYYICTDGSVNLAAPESVTYKWGLYNSKNEDITATLKCYETCGPSDQEFRFYLPLSYPAVGVGTYKIELEVTDAVGNPYNDTATLIVYEQANF